MSIVARHCVLPVLAVLAILALPTVVVGAVPASDVVLSADRGQPAETIQFRSFDSIQFRGRREDVSGDKSNSGGDGARSGSRQLQLHPFDASAVLQCSDGSPHGVFTEQRLRPSGWVLWFDGGGACRNASDCQAEQEQEPWKFGSQAWPQSINGDSLLSADEAINPGTHSYEKWFVPYCSQVCGNHRHLDTCSSP